MRIVICLLILFLAQGDGPHKVYLPMVYGNELTKRFVGDSITSAVPGYVDLVGGGERVITYHIADSILHLQDSGYHGVTVLELGIHAVHGSDRLYCNDPELFRYRYWQLIDAAREHSGEVVIINIPWLDWGPKKAVMAQEFNAIIADMADQMDLCVVDAWTVMEQCGLACIGADGFHPNSMGHSLIAGEVYKCW